MDWIERESFRLFCPELADEFVRCEALQGLEASREIIGCDEVRQMRFELLMTVVVIAFDGRFLDRSVHALDLTVRPGVFDLGQPAPDAILPAADVEHVRHVSGGGTIGIARRERELNAVAG